MLPMQLCLFELSDCLSHNLVEHISEGMCARFKLGRQVSEGNLTKLCRSGHGRLF